MAIRKIEIFLKGEYKADDIKKLLEEKGILDIWYEKMDSSGRDMIKILVSSEGIEEITDILQNKYGNSEGFRIIVSPIEATIPKIESEEKPEDKKKPYRISREELYADISEYTKFNSIYFVMVIISSLVASIGFIYNNIAVIVGAMVIAPLLGPNVALAFSFTLGDTKLALKSARNIAAGILVAFAVSVVIGYFFNIHPEKSEITLRIRAELPDIILALAAGTAGVLAFTTVLPASLIGVMVAVALLPPLVVSGLLLGSGEYGPALGALLLFLVNMVCINLSGILTFLVQKVRPRTWWEEGRAKKETTMAIVFWMISLLFLAGVIILIKIYGKGL